MPGLGLGIGRWDGGNPDIIVIMTMMIKTATCDYMLGTELIYSFIQ